MSSVQVLATMFGTSEWDQAPPVSSTGRFTGQHNIWTRQFEEDLSALFEACDSEVCLPALRLPSVLFTTDYIRDSFLSLDTKAILSASKSVRIPPPGTIMQLVFPVVLEDLPYACVCTLSDGSSVCEKKFKSCLALTMHITLHHGQRALASSLTCANSCIVCCNVYSSRMYAVRHLEKCIKEGVCPRSAGFIAIRTVAFSAPHICAICKESFDTFIEARAHLVGHLLAQLPNISISLS